MPEAFRALASDRASRLIAGIGFSVFACLGVLGAYLCVDLHDSAWRNAERSAHNILALIEEGVGRSIRFYDLSLREAARLSTRPDIAALDPGTRRLALFGATARSGDAGMIAITDAAGTVVMTSDSDLKTMPDLADLPDIRTHRADPAAGLIVTGPVRSRTTGGLILRMSRRIENPDGSFGGVVFGAMPLDQIQASFERLRIEPGNAVNIFHRDGTLLVRAPSDPAVVGRSIAAGEPYRRYRASERGHFVDRAQLDGATRFFTFVSLVDLPIIMNVGTSTDSIRGAWIYKAGIVAALIFCLSALTIGLTLLLQREVAHRAAQEASSRAANAELAVLARTDGLTGLPNRRSYDEALAEAWPRAARTGQPLSLLLVDADHFKQFNDRFGHHRGDEVLRQVAGCLHHAGGPAGMGFRIGGEEFAVILPGLGLEAAQAAGERVRRAVASLQIAHAPEVGGVATVSVGLACASPRAGDAPDALFADADAALYAAKRAGRNRVRTTPGSEPSPLARSA